MRKQILLFVSGVMILASCSSSNNNDIQIQEALIDSTARANAAQQEQLNRKRNDSIINAIAVVKADSIEKVTKTTAAPAKETDPLDRPDPPQPAAKQGKNQADTQRKAK